MDNVNPVDVHVTNLHGDLNQASEEYCDKGKGSKKRPIVVKKKLTSPIQLIIKGLEDKAQNAVADLAATPLGPVRSKSVF